MTREGGEARAKPVPRGASAFTGKTVLVDVSYADSTGECGGRRQYHGVIETVTERNVELLLTCGKTIDLPPDLSLYRPASPGAHHLPSTGEVVAHVDLVIAFTASGPYGAGALKAVTQPG